MWDGSTKIGNREYTLTFEMSELWYRLQGFDRHDQGAQCLATLCNRTWEDKITEDAS